jgi:transcriptional regulator PpsR
MPRESLPLVTGTHHLDGFGADAFARLAQMAGDIALVMTADGDVLDVAFASDDPTGAGRDAWTGRTWTDLVTIESRPKIAAMLAAADAGEAPRWRQVNHPANDGDVPVRYLAVGAGQGGNIVAIGTDLRATAALQQRLIQTQQSLERDYLKLRQAEARYRLLFDLDRDPVLVIDAEARRIREANPSAHRLVGAKPGALVNRALTSVVDSRDHDRLLAYLGAAGVSDAVEPLAVALAGKRGAAHLSATPFRQDRAAFLLVRLADSARDGATATTDMSAAIDYLPDAVVVTDAALWIVASNIAFVDLIEDVSQARVTGAGLGEYVGRVGIDLDLLIEQLRQHGTVRNFVTVVRGRAGAVDDVEISAAQAPGRHGDGFVFSIRSIARRTRDLPPAAKDMPRSVEQLTELVGRMSLKDIVRESTDLIERLCIEAALQYTSDNRASAAEILGVSRQSLYSKLHRHGLGNLVGDEE